MVYKNATSLKICADINYYKNVCPIIQGEVSCHLKDDLEFISDQIELQSYLQSNFCVHVSELRPYRNYSCSAQVRNVIDWSAKTVEHTFETDPDCKFPFIHGYC